ncbi:hypothetical protein LJK88_50800 [Paenibacillus sp. P26]|nr:hypothetical protein LJK88_50800 [Paenibacillus sp. P26]
MKILQWSLKLAVTAAVTSVCCMVLTFAAVNTYVNMLAGPVPHPETGRAAARLGAVPVGHDPANRRTGGGGWKRKRDGGWDWSRSREWGRRRGRQGSGRIRRRIGADG